MTVISPSIWRVGNVRNPVGPLPSSIYWRRRAVVLLLLLLLIALIVWAVTSGGSAPTAGRSAQGPSAGRTPEASITPGPTSSQTGITARPGGRDTSGGGSGSGGSDAGSGVFGSGGSAGAGGTGGTGSGTGAPAGSGLPDCAPGQVQLRVRALSGSYPPGRNPAFEVSAVNSQGSACQVNFGSTATVLTVTSVPGDAHVWASDDCPASREAVWREVPAGGSAAYRVQWDRTVTAPQCATPSQSADARPGTYHVTVSGDGLGTAQASFVLTMS